MGNIKKNKTPEEIIESYVRDAIDSTTKEQSLTNIQDLVTTYNDIRKTNSNIELNTMIINAWSKEKREERNQKSVYIKILSQAFTFTIAGLFLVFILIGAGYLKYEIEVLKLFLNCVYIEIIAAFIYILKELFKNSSKDLLDFLNKFNKK